jgi:hypothetical protein
MAKDRVSASAVIDAPPDVIFGVLADPTKHAAIDGTGWVCEPLDLEPLTAPGQMFRMAMYHPKHPDGGYQMSNRVQVFDPPLAISWEPGHYADDGNIRYGGWVWRYDLVGIGLGRTEVKLTYDWSEVPDSIREYLHFPPFGPDHLGNSLAHLAELAVSVDG